ncbi:AAA family ATPase [Allofournierella massiliensis]|uniref:Nuclease SbcCD subunit C n=1 Tax=Allofournierella massiliensis TaxID=1650663 RepID=A0A4R1QXV4_9FIRM|nr:AAA family ATPase [Fournierella massiliensis]TCL57094.1 DNA sulfur modification protein DndD [Fournierella massiliensis]
MLIESITLHNFRQFKGKQRLEFSNDPQKNVTVLLGDNTFGKTTILQAFNWCLYGVADFPKDSNPDFLLNLEIANEFAGVQQKSEVYVELMLIHKDMEYIILRKQPYVDRGYGNWTALQPQINVSYKENGITKPVREGEEQRIINSILPQSLSGYFFFDTERVSDISSRKDLSDAVRGLLGLAAVGNARKHLGARTLKATAIGQWSASLDSSGDERAKRAQETIAHETERMEALENEIKRAEKELVSLNAQKERIAEILRDNQNTAELQRKKQAIESNLESERIELEKCNKLFLGYFSNSAITYFMLPLMDQAENCLVNANVDDRGIRDMTESSIRDIIKRGRCICGAKIEVGDDGQTGNSAYLHILEELRFLPPAHIGTAIQNFKQLVSTDRRNIALFYPMIEQKYKDIQRHRDTIASLEDEITHIDKSIFGKENMGSYEADMNRIKDNIKRMTEKKAKCDRDIGACQSAIESAQKVYDSLVSTSERNQKLITYIAYAEQICNWIDETYAEKEQEMRVRLQERVNDIFGKMYHGQRKVQIDKQYHVTLFAQLNGKEIITGESEGLKRVKNFAFIAGLVDLAKEKATMGRNTSDSITWDNEAYPLVMDAPFSNADETHIKNISAVLPEVANQVIMFVMEKDWQYAEPVIAGRVGKYCKLNKRSESHTQIIE